MLFRRSKQKTNNYYGWFTWLAEKEKRQALRFSRFLQVRTRRLSATRLKVCCLVVFSGMLTINASIAWRAFHGHSTVIPHTPVSIPAHIVMPPVPGGIPGPGRVKDIHFLDSLLKIPECRKTYDSVLRFRPGLADTIQQLQNLNR